MILKSYFMRGYLMQSMDDTKQAEQLYRRGLELAPDQTTMRRRLAEVLIETGELDEAESELSLCVKQSPEDAEIGFLLAQMRTSAAISSWRQSG